MLLITKTFHKLFIYTIIKTQFNSSNGERNVRQQMLVLHLEMSSCLDFMW